MPDASLLSDSLQNDAVFANQQGLDVNWGTAQKDIISALQPSWIWGGPGDDQVSGSAYTDWFRLSGSLKDYWWQASAEMQVVIHDFENSRDGNDSLNNIEWLQFHDATVDLTLPDLASQMDPYDLQRLSELYVGFFNRVPEADGMRYWIEKFLGGSSLLEIADQFYEAGIYFGVYAADMTEADFITEVYANALGRTGLTAPDESEVGYWENWLAQPGNSKGGMVLAMLNDVHTFFSDDPEWGFVSELLENKAAMAQYFAIKRGISYRDPLDNIQVGRQMAGEITPEGIEQAVAALGLPVEPPTEPMPEPEPEAPENEGPELSQAVLAPMEEDSVRHFSVEELLAFATDPEGDALSVTEFTANAGQMGTLENDASGGWVFTPQKDFNGTVSFSLTISDGQIDTTGSLEMRVTPVNDAPEVAAEQHLALLEDGRIEFSVDAQDADGDQLDFSFAPPRNGSLRELADTGQFLYVPYPSFAGEDRALVQVKDSAGETALQEIFFTVEPRNSIPVAGDDLANTDENSVLQMGFATGLLANDTDEDGDPLLISKVLGSAANVGEAVSGTGGGVFTISADGSYRFDPATDFDHLLSGESAVTQVTYEVVDGQGGRDTATVSVTVAGVGTASPAEPTDPTPQPPPDEPEPSPPPADAYDIDFSFLDSGAQQYASYFTNAATRLESIITEGVADVSYQGGIIDDLLIEVSVEPIDGEYGVLGSAGPDFWRPGTYLPYLGGMRFDSADMAWMATDGTLADVIVHEMLHVLGLGTLWSFAGLISGDQYIGDNALDEYKALSGDTGANGITLTTGVGPGSDYGHWDEGTFDNELMTPFINDGNNPLSRITVGALEDLGYNVDYSQADGYSLPASVVHLTVAGSNSTNDYQDLLIA